MKYRIVRRTLLPALLAAFVMTLAGSCSILFASFFGDELMYADASINLFDVLWELEDADNFDISIRRLRSPSMNSDSLAIYVSTMGSPPRVVLLDPNDLSLQDTVTQAEATILNPTARLFNHLSVAASGMYNLGNCEYNPSTGLLTTWNTFLNSAEGNYFYCNYFYAAIQYMFFGKKDIGIHYFIGPALNFDNTIMLVPFFPNTSLLCSALLDGKWVFVLRKEDGSLAYTRVDPANPGLSVSLEELKVSNLSTDSSSPQMWLTPDGLIARPKDSQLLTRYDMSTGLAIDSINLDDKNKLLYFENDGSAFYVFDRVSGLMIKSKTWWK